MNEPELTTSEQLTAEAEPRKRSRRITSLLIQLTIAVFWGIMMAFLIIDFFLPPDVTSPAVAIDKDKVNQDWVDYEEWMKVDFLAFPIAGAMSVEARKIPDTREYAFTTRYVLSQSKSTDVGGLVQIDMAARLTEALTLEQFMLNITLPSRKIKIRGFLDDKTLYYGIQPDGRPERISTLEMKGNMAFLDGLQSMLPRQMKLEVGEQYRFHAFDPVWNFSGGDVVMEVVNVEFLKIDDIEYEVYRIDFKFQNFTTSTWVTRNGEIMKRRVGNMVEMIRVDPAELRHLPEFNEPLEPPDYTLDDFVLYMNNEQPERSTGLFGLLGELMKAGSE